MYKPSPLNPQVSEETPQKPLIQISAAFWLWQASEINRKGALFTTITDSTKSNIRIACQEFAVSRRPAQEMDREGIRAQSTCDQETRSKKTRQTGKESPPERERERAASVAGRRAELKPSPQRSRLSFPFLSRRPKEHPLTQCTERKGKVPRPRTRDSLRL